MGVILLLCREVVGVFYSPDRMGSLYFDIDLTKMSNENIFFWKVSHKFVSASYRNSWVDIIVIVFANGPGDRGSTPGRVILKT